LATTPDEHVPQVSAATPQLAATVQHDAALHFFLNRLASAELPTSRATDSSPIASLRTHAPPRCTETSVMPAGYKAFAGAAKPESAQLPQDFAESRIGANVMTTRAFRSERSTGIFAYRRRPAKRMLD
jgi:hypothetical protein